MKRITIIKTCTLSSLLIILVNCGGDSDSSSVSATDDLEQKAQGVQIQTANIPFGQAMNQSSISTSNPKIQGKVSQKLESGNTYKCAVSGTFGYENFIDENGTVYEGYTNNKCRWKLQEDGNIIEENGFSLYMNDDDIIFGYSYSDYTQYIDAGSDITKYNENTYYSYPSLFVVETNEDNINVYFLGGEAKYIKNSNLEETYTYKEYGFASSEELVHIEGSESIKTPCATVSNFYADYNDDFNILTKHTKPGYYESGIILVNGFKYNYDGEYVTISKGDKVDTINQATLVDTTSCSQKVAFSYDKIDVHKLEKNDYQDKFNNMSSKLKAHISKYDVKK